MQHSGINILRGALICLFLSPLRAQKPIHTSSLKNFFCDYYSHGDFDFALKSLVLLKEIVKLPHGYWLPTPTRKIQFQDFDLILSSNPSYQLSSLISKDLEDAGHGRVVKKNESLDSYPSEKLHDWLEIPLDLKKWTLETLADASAKLLMSTLLNCINN